MRKSMILSLGIAIFTMLFGAGNIVFPLAIGRAVGDKVGFAMVGFFITAIIVPLLGLVATMLFDGDYKRFFNKIGVWPGFLCSLLCMILIGPFGATPRCITLSYSALSWYLPGSSLFIFSLLSVLLIFALTAKKGRILTLFGKVLGPLKLALLLSIIIFAFMSSNQLEPASLAPWGSFLTGLKEGFFTMDLLGTIFFSSLVYGAIYSKFKSTIQPTQDKKLNSKFIAHIGLKAGILGGGLLAVVYLGFCLVAAMHSGHMAGVPKEQLLSAIACLVLGNKAGILANITVAIACLTGAMALATIFADYMSTVLFKGRLSYTTSLGITLLLVLIMSNFGFSGIMAIIEPIASVCYPTLVALALANIAYKLLGFKWTKATVYMTFIVTVFLYLRHL